MALNQKAIKVLGKVFEAGFTDEKSIAAMTMDDILAIQGITILWACGLCAGFTGIDNYIQKENKGLSADSALPCAVDDRPLLSCCRTGTVRYGVLRSKECVSP